VDELARWNIARTRARHRRTIKQRLRLAGLQIAGLRYARAASAVLPRRVLLIRPDHLGDVLFVTPAIHAIRAALPEARLSALVGPWSQAVLTHNPHLNEVLTLPFPGFDRTSRSSIIRPYQIIREASSWLREMNFDTALIFRPDHWWGAWLAAEARIYSRLGFGVPETRPFLTSTIPHQDAGRTKPDDEFGKNNMAMRSGTWAAPLMSPPPHHVEQNIALARTLVGGEEGSGPARPSLIFVIPPGTAAPLRSGNLETVAIHPGSGAAVKLWGEEGWAKVGDALGERLGARVALTGSEAEQGLCARIAARMREPPLNLAGRTSLAELAALYRNCRLVVGPDSGPLHLAVAVGTPTLHLFGPADPGMYGPWGDEKRHRVLMSPMACAPCRILDWTDLENHPCMATISVEAVVDAANELWELKELREPKE